MKGLRVLRILGLIIVIMVIATIVIKLVHYNLWDFLKDNTYDMVSYNISIDTSLGGIRNNSIYKLLDGVTKDGKVSITGEYDSVNKVTHILSDEAGLSQGNKLDITVRNEEVYIHKDIISRLVYTEYTSNIVDSIIGKDIEYIMINQDTADKADKLLKQLGNTDADLSSVYSLLVGINNNLRNLYSGTNTVLAKLVSVKSCSKEDGVYRVVYTDKDFHNTINGVSSFTDKLYNILLKPLSKLDDGGFLAGNIGNVVSVLDNIYNTIDNCSIECKGYKGEDGVINCNIGLSGADEYINIDIGYKESEDDIKEIKNYLSIDNIVNNISSEYNLG